MKQLNQIEIFFQTTTVSIPKPKGVGENKTASVRKEEEIRTLPRKTEHGPFRKKLEEEKKKRDAAKVKP